MTLLVGAIGFVIGTAADEPRVLRFADRQSLSELALVGDVGIDATRDRSGGAGGALRVEPGAKAVWKLRDTNASGTVELWVYDDGSKPTDPKKRAAGPIWGLMQKTGPLLVVGPIYAPYLSGDRSYAAGHFDPTKGGRPWRDVQYLAIRRTPGWHRWTFRFDPDAGLAILFDGKDVNARRKLFYWNKTGLSGVTGLVLFGDATDAKQTLWIDDVSATLGGPPTVHPIWPPPPSADLAPVAPLAARSATPYAPWANGPSKDPNYFPIAVWLQAPKNAKRYKAAGFNVYVGLWKGPTEEQLAALRAADMPVICAQNGVGLKHLDDKLIVGWMHGDEPDNAQKRPDGKGYGPPIKPERIVADYRKIVAADPSRPVLLNLGQGVAWDKWYGRGVRANHPEDYPEYVKGCDIASFDIYPVVHRHPDVVGRLWRVPFGVTRLRQWTGDKKGVWNCIECTRISNVTVKPTPHQVRAEVWMSIIFGSRGLIYFVHQFKPKFIEAGLFADADMLDAVTAINRQVHSLAAVINSPVVPDAGTVTSSVEYVPVRMTVRKHGGATYVFAASLFHEATQATFRLPGLGQTATVDVLGEARKATATNGRFTDHFKGYDVHLYKIH